MEFKFKSGDVVSFTGIKPNDFHHQAFWFTETYFSLANEDLVGKRFTITGAHPLCDPIIPTYTIKPLFPTNIVFGIWLFPEDCFSSVPINDIPTIF